MKRIKLFEAYVEEFYNRVLDMYNKSGMDGLTQEEKEYLKSGGESEVPKSLTEKKEMDCPFVVTLAEDITRRYFDDDFWKSGEGSNKPWSKEGNAKYLEMLDDNQINYKTFVFKNYKPIPINDKNMEFINCVNWDSNYFHEKWPYNQAWDDDDLKRMKQRYFHSNYEQGLVFWYFDCQFPNHTKKWNKWVENGGLQGIEGGGDLIASTIRDTMGYEVPEKEYNFKMYETLQIDLKRQPLTLEILIKEIARAEQEGKLGNWINDSDKLLDRNNGYLPAMSGERLFDVFYT